MLELELSFILLFLASPEFFILDRDFDNDPAKTLYESPDLIKSSTSYYLYGLSIRQSIVISGCENTLLRSMYTLYIYRIDYLHSESSSPSN